MLLHAVQTVAIFDRGQTVDIVLVNLATVFQGKAVRQNHMTGTSGSPYHVCFSQSIKLL
jgi:hypothetical protein